MFEDGSICHQEYSFLAFGLARIPVHSTISNFLGPCATQFSLILAVRYSLQIARSLQLESFFIVPYCPKSGKFGLMKRHAVLLAICILLWCGQAIKSQENPMLLAEFSYSWGFPAADLAKRFGTHLSLGVGLTYQPAKNNFNFGSRFSYFFGADVKEDVLAPFRTSLDGLLIGSDQFLAEMKLKERGFLIQLHAGGLIQVFSQLKARQSLKWQMGIGFIQHHIRFVDDARALSHFHTEYLKGLDRLSNGLAVIPFVAYEFISRKGLLSFYTGVEPVFAFTKNRRSLNYDTNQSELDMSRLDVLINFKIGLYLPFRLSNNYENIEY